MSAAEFRLRAENGGVLVFTALLMLIFVLLGGVAVDLGNSYVHKRHLQTQVDAAALAGAGKFGRCFIDSATTANQAIYDEATLYSGVTGSPYNKQVGTGINGGAVAMRYQSNTYADGSAASYTTPTSGPCDLTHLTFDVKGTEENPPTIINFRALVPTAVASVGTVRAHAQVKLKTVTTMKGLLPVAVPDPRFNFVWATFVNESTGTPLAAAQLQPAGTAGGLQLWTTAAPVDVAIGSASVGLRLRLIGGTDANATCGSQYVECYDGLSSNGLVHIRGWTNATAPTVHNAWLLKNNCAPDAYFTLADCSAGLQAEVDLGSRFALTGSGITTEVWATVDGGGKYPLTPGGSSGLVTWTANGGVPLIGPGPHDVGLEWSWKQTTGTWEGNDCTKPNRCKAEGSLGKVQRGFVATDDRSGPVQMLQISQGASSSGANSFGYGTVSLGVTLGVTGTLKVQSLATDPVVKLRVTGSQSQTLDCDPALNNIKEEIEFGCGPSYKINPSLVCPSYNALWGTAQPWPCVKVQTGGAVSQPSDGLEARILGGAKTCTAPNNWPNYPTGDPRVVPLIITPFGSFTGTGNTTVPVIDFAAFYITSWGGPGGDPCPGAIALPKGYIAGHFVKYAEPNPNAQADAICDPTAITPCVAVMTR